MTEFLAPSLLNRVAPVVQVPVYDRAKVSVGIVHFGPGAFHRVHQAWFVEKLLEADPRWGICAVSLRNPDVRDALAPQDGLYTLVALDETISYQVIGALKEIRVAPENPQAVLDRLCAAQTRVVTVTVTEKGYCLGADGTLDFEHPDILQDIRNPRSPTSLIGFLVEALERRQAAGLDPLTVISCDNLVDNGSRLGRAVVQLAEHRGQELASWIERNVLFPRTMVDSITPATTSALRERVEHAAGVADRWPVQREGFVQWVIEDRLLPGGPDWAAAGAIITDNVAAYDRAKLRLLNGAHSTLAYVGLLSGHETVSEAMADPELALFVSTMMRQEILPAVKAPRGLDLEVYIEAILKRFRNPALRHALSQIAWDGSQKIPFRLLGTITDNLAAGRSINRLCTAIAAWMHFVRRKALMDERVVDPLAAKLFDLGLACQNRGSADVPAFLTLETVFPRTLVANEVFRSTLVRVYDSLAGR
jgi:fructuronate reductase